MREIDDILSLYTKAEYCGSRVTCKPPPTDTDLDVLVLTDHSLLEPIYTILTAKGWELGGSLPTSVRSEIHNDERFDSYTRGEVNIIITASEVFYDKFLLATNVSKFINLMDKDHRVALFQAIIYGIAPL